MQIWDDWRGAALRDVIAAEAQRNPLDGRDYDPQVRSLQLLAVTLLIKLSLTPSLLFVSGHCTLGRPAGAHLSGTSIAPQLYCFHSPD